MKSRKKQTIILSVIVFILLLGLGYAYLNSNLSINGTTNITSSSWNVYWNNVQIKTGSVTDVTTPATIQSGNTLVVFNVNLKEPGDYYEFTVDAVNSGSIDAMIGDLTQGVYASNGTTPRTLPEYLEYTVTYEDGIPIAQNHLLAHNTTETYKVRVYFKEDINANQLPSTDDSIVFKFGVEYVQATSAGQAVEHPVSKYTISDTLTYIGQAIPSGITQYNSAAEAMAAFSNRPFYLKHTVQGGVVTESYTEFVVTPTMASANPGMTAGTYAIRGFVTYDANAASTSYCKPEYYNSVDLQCHSPYYESNKAVLLSAFGSSHCTDNSFYYYCYVSGLYAYNYMQGLVFVSGDDYSCSISNEGFSKCEH